MSGSPVGKDALRLTIGTFTVFPTRPPGVVDRRVASWAMVLAPLAGVLLAVAGGLLLWLLGWGPPGDPSLLRPLLGNRALEAQAHPFLAATLVVGLLALLTRAMHLDGLADTADGLGSGRDAAGAMEVMGRGDVGPFGVVSLVLVLLLQALALGVLAAEGLGLAALFLALVVSRLAPAVLCSRGIPAARAEGLGHLVAGTVGRTQLFLAAGLGGALLLLLALVSPGVHALGGSVVLRAGVAAAVGLGVGLLVARRAVSRLGGVTGDVLGAGVETTFTATLVALTVVV